VLHHSARMARPARRASPFGPPIRLTGDDYVGLAKQVEDGVRAFVIVENLKSVNNLPAIHLCGRIVA
jgi:hypothetical protein